MSHTDEVIYIFDNLINQFWKRETFLKVILADFLGCKCQTELWEKLKEFVIYFWNCHW